MTHVDITVNDRVYKVTCGDGEEPRLQRLADHIDGHVRGLVKDLGQVGDARLILLAALTICDDLFEAKDRLAEIESGGTKLDPETVGGAAHVIDAAARRVDGLAARMQDA